MLADRFNRLPKDKKAGLYITVIVHCAVIIVLLIAGIGANIPKEDSFVLDFSKYEDIEKMKAEMKRLEEELAFKEAISKRLQSEIGRSTGSELRSVAVDRSSLKDDRGTDAEKLYEDARKLQEALDKTFSQSLEDEELVPISTNNKSVSEISDATKAYTGPSVVSYDLGGRKASKLSIPAYRCMGAGEVTVIITVNPSGVVTAAKVDESCSSSDSCLRSFAIRAARTSKFSAKADAAAKQIGNIVYSFVAQ